MMKNPYSGIWLSDGLSDKEAQRRYKKRRQNLATKIGHITVIFGTHLHAGGKNPWAHPHTPIYQDPLMLFLTGINQTETALVLDPQSTEKEWLFVPQKNPHLEFWEGPKLGVGSSNDNEALTKINKEMERAVRYTISDVIAIEQFFNSDMR